MSTYYFTVLRVRRLAVLKLDGFGPKCLTEMPLSFWPRESWLQQGPFLSSFTRTCQTSESCWWLGTSVLHHQGLSRNFLSPS